MRILAGLIAAVACVSGGCEPTSGHTPECVMVVGTTDTHGALDPETIVGTEGVSVTRHGVLALSGYVNILRQKFGERLLLVDAGDLYQGTLVSRVSRGEAMIKAYNQLGYRAAALGNHEFDYGPLDSDDPDVFGVLKARIRDAHFPFLAANLFDTKTGERPDWPNLKPSVMVAAGGMSVGIVGVITTETPRVTRPQFVAGLEFRDPIPAITAQARELRASGARLVVLLAHFGGKCRRLADPNDTSSCDPNSELFAVLKRLPRGTVDVVLGGHTHAQVSHWVRETLVLQPAAQGRQFALAEVCAKPQGGIDPITSTLYGNFDMCIDEWLSGGCGRDPNDSQGALPAVFLGELVEPDPVLENAMKPYLNAVRTMAMAPVGVRLPQPLVRDAAEGSLGDLVAAAMAEATEADVAIQNRGGVRDDLPAGVLSYGDVFEVLPFENRLMTFALSGAELKAFIDLLVTRREGLPPYVSGLRLKQRGNGTTEALFANGDELAEDRLYKVTTNDYLGTGGEGSDSIFRNVPANRQQLREATVLEALVSYLRKHYPDVPAPVAARAPR